MSMNKIKSLKLQRHEPVITIEESPPPSPEDKTTRADRIDKSSRYQEHQSPLHSTPKRCSGQTSVNQESFENHASPILLPCTQDGGNEVAWDWQSPLMKGTVIGKNGETANTPKRTTALQKKRHSNSPLLYKPTKRKLMKNDIQEESVSKFAAEMKAICEQIKTVPREDGNRVATEQTENANSETTNDDELLVQINIDEFVESDERIEEKMSKEQNSDREKEKQVVKTSVQDLFDDSIDDCMVKCSQEVEEKLKLESYREFPVRTKSESLPNKPNVAWLQHSYTNPANDARNTASSSKIIENKNEEKNWKNNPRKPEITKHVSSSDSNTHKSNNNWTKTNNPMNAKSSVACLNNNSLKVMTNPQPVATTSKNQIFEIPDDSLDEDFLSVDFDDVVDPGPEKCAKEKPATGVQSANRYGKVYKSPHGGPASENLPKRTTGTTARKSLLAPILEANVNLGKIFPRSPSTDDSLLYSSSRAMTSATTSQSSTSQGRKFFKTKSHSSSNFDNSDRPGQSLFSAPVGTATTNRANINSTTCMKNGKITTSVSMEERTPAIRANKGDNAWPIVNGSQRNCGKSDFDRNAPRDDGNRCKIVNGSVQQNGTRSTATGSQATQTICTPAEIERKRQEAKMKLEMKRKLQARSKSAGILPTCMVNRPVKR